MATAVPLTRARRSIRLIAQAGPEPSRTGIWIGLAAITMTFAAFTSAMIVRSGSAEDWRHFTLPAILYLNALILAGSSMSLEFSRRKFAANQTDATRTLRLLYVTFGLGQLFIAGQYLAFIQLRKQGVYLASAPSASFFYVLTCIHALHFLGGISGLSVVVRRLKKRKLTVVTLEAVSRYWHFMTILWLYLLVLLWMRI